MAQTKHEIQSLLAGAGTEPRHRFGQNFMIDQNLVRLVADAGGIGADDLVIEVGPGTGTLTEELLARGARVVAVEIDRDLAGLLRERFAGNDRFALIEGDALAGKHALNAELLERIDAARREPSPQPARGQPPIPLTSPGAPGEGVRGWAVKLVANLPYNIASPLVIELLIAGVEVLAFVVQKEVGDRLRAKEGSDDYGPLTVMAQMLSRVEFLRKLPPAAFWPAPKIDSALIRMTRADRLGARAGAFSRFVHQVFSGRRKTLRKALVTAELDADAILAKVGLDPQRRAEELSPETFWAMFEAAGAAGSRQ
jgi:16S rRNA (adenine1518-N6/adenine1519-N6)-dimethyltransferase